MFHFIYKTTNLIDGCYYYGVHSTDDIDDGYYGSGKILKRALNKYGKEAFKREIIVLFSDRDSALFYESKLVTVEMIKDHSCYNMCEGGGSPPTRSGIVSHTNKLTGDNRTEKQKKASQNHSEKMKGTKPWNYGLHNVQEVVNKKDVIVNDIYYSSYTEAGIALNKSPSSFTQLVKKYKTNKFILDKHNKLRVNIL